MSWEPFGNHHTHKVPDVHDRTFNSGLLILSRQCTEELGNADIRRGHRNAPHPHRMCCPVAVDKIAPAEVETPITVTFV